MDPITIALGLATTYAPDIVKYFTGSDKAAAVASHVVGIAQAVTGVSAPDAAAAALAADPAKALEFQQRLMDTEADLIKAQYADLANARHMQEAALGQDDLFSKRFVYYFSIGWSLYAMFYMTMVTFWPPATEGGKANANVILGFLLGTAVASIFNFFMGTTKASEAKTKLLALMSPPAK